MKRAKFIILLILIPLTGFSQKDFDHGILDTKTINDTIKKTIFHFDAFVGTFLPTQKARLIGIKPTFGGSFGICKGRMTYDFTMEIRFGRTKDRYQLANSDMTNHYSGGYFGIDIMPDIWRNKKNQILLLGGAGLDMFQIVPAKYRDQSFLEDLIFGDDNFLIKDSKSIISFNINFGLMYRFYYKEKNYFGLRYRYNIVDYNSNKILTDVTGNFHSISISYGLISKNTKKSVK